MMLTIKQILDAVSDVTAAVFPGEPVHADMAPVEVARPSSWIEMTDSSMEAESPFVVSRTMTVSVTRFCAVDDDHNSQTERLANDLALLQAAFAQGTLTVEDRYLNIGRVSGKYGAGFTQLSIPLSWWDNNDVKLPEFPVIEHYEMNEEVTQ